MKSIWQFSSSSETQIQKVLEISSKSKNKDMKWSQFFGHKHTQTNPINCDDNNCPSEENPAAFLSPDVIIEDDTNNTTEISEKVKELCEDIESDLNSKFLLILTELTKNCKLLNLMANSLSETNAEKFCRMIYGTENVDQDFVRNYLQFFLPVVLTKSQSWFSIDSLTMASKKFTDEFGRTFIPTIVKDVSVPKNIMQDFAELSTAGQKTEYLKQIAEVKLTKEQLGHNLLFIIALYKDSDKSSGIQNFVQSLLLENSEVFASDKNFGRLLLMYLSSLESRPLNYERVEEVVECHRSSMKRPCCAVMKKIKNSN